MSFKFQTQVAFKTSLSQDRALSTNLFTLALINILCKKNSLLITTFSVMVAVN